MGGNSESISSIEVSGFVSLLDETPNLSITEVSEDLLAAITVKVIDVMINAIANIQVSFVSALAEAALGIAKLCELGRLFSKGASPLHSFGPALTLIFNVME